MYDTIVIFDTGIVKSTVLSNDFIPLYFKLTSGRKLKANKFKAESLTEIFNELSKTDKSNVLLITAYLNIICNKVIECGEFEKSSATDGILYQKVISYLQFSILNSPPSHGKKRTQAFLSALRFFSNAFLINVGLPKSVEIAVCVNGNRLVLADTEGNLRLVTGL